MRNYPKCNRCGLIQTSRHRCVYDEPPRIHIGFNVGQGTNRGGVESVRDFVKDVFIGKSFNVPISDRTGIVKLFMEAFKPCGERDRYKAKRMTQFLKRYHLSRAEVHAVIFSTGFRYANEGNATMKNLCINGYYSHSYDKPFGQRRLVKRHKS